MFIVKLGEKGNSVVILQRALQRENLLPQNTNTVKYDDGIFGKGTENAVKQYQKQLGVSENGIVGNYFSQKIGIVINPSKTIVLTAGHNSIKDSGAVSKDKKWTEARIVTDLRNRVKKLLEADGYIVVTDGVGEENLILSKAVALIPMGEVAIELHLNAAESEQANGIEALAKIKLKSKCQTLCSSISNDMKYKIRGVDGGWKSTDSGQHTRLAFCEAGGIILELFFISNKSELDSYITNPDRLAKSIAEAIKKL